jgi:hypothetical protein
MKYLRHLSGCIPARPGISHGQHSRDTFGREEQIAALVTQLAVQFDGKRVVVLCNLGEVG